MPVGDRSTLSQEKLLAAVRQVISEHGIEGIRVRRVAAAAGVSPPLVLYHYPDQATMMLRVHQDLVSDYFGLRESLVLRETGAVNKLRACAAAGLPPNVAPEVVAPLFDLHSLARRSHEHSQLMTELWELEIALYVRILSEGIESGAFRTSRPLEEVASSILAMEDGLALHLIGRNDSLGSDRAIRSLLTLAAYETQCTELLEIPPPRVEG